MKLIFSILLLLSITFNANFALAHHNKTIEVDGWEFDYDTVKIKFYNKSSKKINYIDGYNYDFEVTFKDGSKRIYSPEVSMVFCYPKTDCIFNIKLNREDVKNVRTAH